MLFAASITKNLICEAGSEIILASRLLHYQVTSHATSSLVLVLNTCRTSQLPDCTRAFLDRFGSQIGYTWRSSSNLTLVVCSIVSNLDKAVLTAGKMGP